MSIPANASPSNGRQGFHVPVWMAAVAGALVLVAGGFILGRVVANHRDGVVRVGPLGGRVIGGRVFTNGGMAHPWFWVVVGLVLLALVVTGVVLLLRHAPAAPAPLESQATKAEELLAERLARGEIDEADYRSRRDALRA